MHFHKILAVCLATSCILGAADAQAKAPKNKKNNKPGIVVSSKPVSATKINNVDPDKTIQVGGTTPTTVNGKPAGRSTNINKSPYQRSSKNMLTVKDGHTYFLDTRLPDDYKEISLFGKSVVTKAQAVAYIKQVNPNVKLSCTVEQLVDHYWEEAGREGIRPDLAMAQSFVETAVYNYGGDVLHHQNNFCGLGTTGGGVRGASFATAQLGARAHIQHLMAYAKHDKPSTPIIDPRYDLAHRVRVERGLIDKWYGLNGTWAMGNLYCEKIMATYQKMLAMPGADVKDDVKSDGKQDNTSKKRKSMRERVQEIIDEEKK